jgi:hypothetical protein
MTDTPTGVFKRNTLSFLIITILSKGQVNLTLTFHLSDKDDLHVKYERTDRYLTITFSSFHQNVALSH